MSVSAVAGSIPGISPRKFPNKMNRKRLPKNRTLEPSSCSPSKSLVNPAIPSVMTSAHDRTVMPSSGIIGSTARASVVRAIRAKTSRIAMTSHAPTSTGGIFP